MAAVDWWSGKWHLGWDLCRFVGGAKSYDKPRHHIKKQRHYFADKDPYSQSYDFSSSYVWMWELDHNEGWVPKNWCFWTVVLERTLESPLNCREIKQVNPKGNECWVFIGRTDAEAEVPIFWPPVFPVVMYGCESWMIKKAEHWRSDAFELWCWRRLLRVPWTARRSNQSILKEISPDYSLEGLMLKLKLQYLGHLMWRVTHLKRPWCWERLRSREGDDRGCDFGWHHLLNGHGFGWTLGIFDGQGGLVCCSSWGHRVGHDWATELNW